uniref:Cation efflux protein transmembrane domain-containing protein n=1 Tax=Peronospora matthiolae TaxID=2874970 RepID=A0AAV1ULU7_9STRA
MLPCPVLIAVTQSLSLRWLATTVPNGQDLDTEQAPEMKRKEEEKKTKMGTKGSGDDGASGQEYGYNREEERFSTMAVEPTYPMRKLRTDVNQAYFPGKTGSDACSRKQIHSLVDTGNQAILILGLKQASGVPDKKHQYGYTRAAYFGSLISALGIFWLGSGVTVVQGIQSLLDPPKEIFLSWEVWDVLAASFGIDGWVLKRSVQELRASQPQDMSFYKHVTRTKDPFLMAVLLEDMSACVGIVIAGCGIGASHITGNPLWDSLASVSIGVLLGGAAVSLIRMNQKYLLGQYKPLFLETTDFKKGLPLILAWYAEDVTRLVEKEMQEVEEVIRGIYPEAAFIEWEPDGKESEMRAVLSVQTKSSRTSEREAITRALALLARTLERKTTGADRPATTGTSE